MPLLLNNNKNITNLSLYLIFKRNELYSKDFYKCIEQNTSLKKISFKTVKLILSGEVSMAVICDCVIGTLFDALINNKSLKTIKFKLYNLGFLLSGVKIRFDLIVKLLQNNNRIKNLSIKKIKNNNNSELDDIDDVNSFLNYLQSNNTLKKLKIYSNNLNSNLLALVIKNNKTLEYLDLLNSKIQNIDLMLKYLKTNTTLKYLNIKNIVIEDKFYDKETINDIIKEILEYNKNIKIDY